MKLAIFTTDTLHHAHFVREMSGEFGDTCAFEETTSAQPRFATAHPFEEERDRHEAERWFGGANASIADYTQCLSFSRLNDRQAIEQIAAYAPDLTVVFGTGKLSLEVIRACHRDRILNLHGGDPESYRGLDTHLWAVYHWDFGALTTTLHRLDEGLDTGQILDQAVVPLTPGMPLHRLRAENTEMAVELTARAVRRFRSTGRLHSRPQRKRGRYYSFMPAVLKEICVKNFSRFTATLPAG